MGVMLIVASKRSCGMSTYAGAGVQPRGEHSVPDGQQYERFKPSFPGTMGPIPKVKSQVNCIRQRKFTSNSIDFTELDGTAKETHSMHQKWQYVHDKHECTCGSDKRGVATNCIGVVEGTATRLVGAKAIKTRRMVGQAWDGSWFVEETFNHRQTACEEQQPCAG